ncbi:hypothetical protein AB6A40_010614 [Gnathostoma spinigerum]|uniref:Integrase catalytic domain-containing protein n=1 Tax=Gnathostoma spinigerum TaxID=75299 RepID=A0ABD6EWP9_9BILA
MEVKRIVRSCTICRRYQGASFTLPQMPNLPETRVMRSSPFKYTGVDYFGPLEVRRDKERMKVWGCLFTCLTVRAIHIEVVLGLTSEEFINAFRRFIARRGTPILMISDNATTFKGAESALKRAWTTMNMNENLENFAAGKGITWNYITSHAPWKGGFYERLIGIVKSSLKKALGRRILSLDDFTTLLCEIEATVNSRPLTYVYEEIEAKIVRPIDFIIPFSVVQVPDHEIEMDDTDYTPPSERESLWERFKGTLKYLNRFWKIWRDEYLLSLREKQNMKHKKSRNSCDRLPRVGEIVLVSEDGISRGHWKIAKIIEVKASNDEEIRSAVVRTETREKMERPINQLYPLEVYGEEREELVNPEDEREKQDGEHETTDVSQEKESYPKRTDFPVASRTRSKLHVNLIMMVLCCMIVSLSAEETLRRIVELPGVYECPGKLNTTMVNTKVTLATKAYARLDAILCAKITRTVCTRALLRLKLEVIRDDVGMEAISKEACEYMQYRKEYNDIKLYQTGNDSWSSNIPVSYSYGWFGTRCKETVNYHLYTGDVVYHDGSKIVSTISNLDSCVLKRGSCTTKTGIFIWNSTNLENKCHYQKQGYYDSTILNDRLLIPELQMAFVLRAGEQRLNSCGFGTVKYGLNGNVAIIFGKWGKNEMERGSNRVLLLEKVKTKEEDENNPKLQYLYESVDSSFTQRFIEEWQRICVLENQINFIINWISESSATAAAQLMLPTERVLKARMNGNLLFVDLGKRKELSKFELNENLRVRGLEFLSKRLSIEKRKDIVIGMLAGKLGESVNISNHLDTNNTVMEDIENDIDTILTELGYKAKKAANFIQEELEVIIGQWRYWMVSIVLIIAVAVGWVVWVYCQPLINIITRVRNRQRNKPRIEEPWEVDLKGFQTRDKGEGAGGLVDKDKQMIQDRTLPPLTDTSMTTYRPIRIKKYINERDIEGTTNIIFSVGSIATNGSEGEYHVSRNNRLQV